MTELTAHSRVFQMLPMNSVRLSATLMANAKLGKGKILQAIAWIVSNEFGVLEIY